MSTRQLPSIQSCARRAAVLACLRRAGEGAVSGQEIANELGVSRVAVSNHIAALRESGYEIESATRRGYRLLSSPDLPFPFEVYPKIQGRFVQVVGGDVTESTNEDAKALARGGADEGAVVLAARQTRGKGRLGRTWQSPEGGLYASYVLRPSAPPVAVSSLSLVVALGVIDALESFGITGARVKWPNDVLLFDAAGAELGKAAGILLEMAAQIEQVEFVVAGVGLNVHRPEEAIELKDGGRHAAAYLSDVLDEMPSLAELAARQIDCLQARYDAWVENGFKVISCKDEYEQRLAIMGQEVSVSRMDGSLIARGIVLGIDDVGRLLVRAEDGECIPVAAGEVTLRG